MIESHSSWAREAYSGSNNCAQISIGVLQRYKYSDKLQNFYKPKETLQPNTVNRSDVGNNTETLWLEFLSS